MPSLPLTLKHYAVDDNGTVRRKHPKLKANVKAAKRARQRNRRAGVKTLVFV